MSLLGKIIDTPAPTDVSRALELFERLVNAANHLVAQLAETNQLLEAHNKRIRIHGLPDNHVIVTGDIDADTAAQLAQILNKKGSE